MNGFTDRTRGDSHLVTALALCFGLFLFSSAFSIAAAQMSLALCVALSLVLFSNFRRELPAGLHLVFFTWAAHLAWLIISSLVNANPLRSLSCIREEWLVVIIPVGIILHSRENRSQQLIAALACGLLLASTYGVFQHFTGWTISPGQALHRAGNYWRLSGNFSHPLTYGYYVVTATVFLITYLVLSGRSLRPAYRVLLLITSVTGLVASALCNSRGPLVALAVGLVAAGFAFGKWRWMVSLVAGLGILVFVLSPGLPRVFAERIRNDLTELNPEGRLFIWSHSLKISQQSPVFGCGPGNFPDAYLEQLGTDSSGKTESHAHNDFLNQAAIGGYPALGLYLLFWWAVVSQLWRIRRRSGSASSFTLSSAALVASVAFLVGSMTEAAIADEELRQILYVFWAAGLSRSGSITPGSE